MDAVCVYGARAKNKNKNKKPNTCSIQLASKGEQNAKIFQKWETHPCLSRVLQLSWGTQKCGSILIYESLEDVKRAFNTQIRPSQCEL